ncbi:hypothetical protein ACTFG9_06760, partial [Campylobacter jejuni]
SEPGIALRSVSAPAPTPPDLDDTQRGWTLHGDGRRVAPGEGGRPRERLSWDLTIGLGMQHVVAMFGAT